MISERYNINNDLQRGIESQVSKIQSRQEALELWQARWDTSTTGRKTYAFIPHIKGRLKITP